METTWTIVPYTFFTVVGMILENRIGVVGKVVEWIQDKWDGMYKY
jgi:hypothetical protein